jgi:beta-lactamase regulating signal transducer with metallopeptidase domain
MMTEYIIKSSISLFILFGLYWFLLRKEKLFVFIRVFLIFSIVFSLIIPFISIPLNLQKKNAGDILITALNVSIPVFDEEQPVVNFAEYQSNSITAPEPSIFYGRIYFYVFLLFIYLTGVIALLIRFLRNIQFISRQINSSEKIVYSDKRLVLTDSEVNPFCFLNTIFVSKQAYMNNEIAGELLNHELEHIRQAHSIDIIFIELIQILYWFNPVILLFNKAIRVNHEYLADNGAIQNSPDIKTYADKLINYVTCNRNVPLTSGLNPSLTRKRLIMLSKSRMGTINYVARIFVSVNFAVSLFLILSFAPSYSDPILNTTNQNIKLHEEILTDIVSDIDSGKNSQVLTKTDSGKNKNHLIQSSGSVVKGFLVNKYGKYIEGVEILESGKNSGVKTDAMGHFVIQNVPVDANLTFSYEGYVTQTIKPVFSSEMVIRFIIDQEIGLSKETIINNYLPKTGATPLIVIDSIIHERESMYNIDPMNKVSSLIILRGKEASEKYGEKGKNGAIEILTAGEKSLIEETAQSRVSNAGRLIFLDGVIYTKYLDSIPVGSIQNLEVLSDYQSIKRYGEKGKNGVILITSKRMNKVPVEQGSATLTIPAGKAENTNGKDDAVISINGFSYLYRGIANPVDIKVTGIASDKISVEISNGSIKQVEEGWEVVPGDQNESTVTVYVNGKMRLEKKYSVKDIPYPVAVFHNKNSGSISRRMASETDVLEAVLNEPEPDIKFEIVSFIFLMPTDSADIVIPSEGNRLTDKMRTLLADLKSGQSIIFKDIKAIGPDNKMRDLSPIILKLD